MSLPPAVSPLRRIPRLRSGALRSGRRFSRLAAAWWNGERKWTVRGAVLSLVLLTFAQVGLAIWINYWYGDLFDALEARALSELLRLAGLFLLIFGLTMGVTALHLHVKRWVQLDWRRWTTALLLDHWLQRAHLHRLQLTPGEHDNPDGRIAEDVRIATEVAVALAHSLLFSLLILGSFIDILLAVSGSAPLPGTSIEVPGYLVVMAFAYAGVGTVLGLMLGRPLVRATDRLQTVEANLRFGLGRTREHAEAIALTRGEPFARRRAERLFEDVGRGWDRQTLAYLGIVSFSTGYGTLLPVFPILIAAPQYIAGTLTLGMLMQAAQAFQRLTSALSWPIDNLGELARCRASVERVLALYEDMLVLEREEEGVDRDEARIRVAVGGQRALEIDGLQLASPSGEVMLEDFHLHVRAGERVLLSGDLAVTVSLFKAVAGLWPWGRGEIRLPADPEPMMFVPQRPLLPPGSLRAVVSYPHPEARYPSAELHRALECAGISWLTQRLDAHDDWSRVLPLRTQQRLGIARLLLHRPSWIFLQEATDTYSAKEELLTMQLLYRELPGVTLLNISRHARADDFYDRTLVLNRAGADLRAIGGPQS
ncbi:MAG: SbmA/BacA-like family transporter [Burkholderiaceae bacterium]|nr:SbmA/BacA-like family transporter [Burkholderiaceae bacterium]